MGPNIGKCCFEVDEDVKDMFYNKFKTLGNIDEIIKKSENNNKYYIDTGLINRILLCREGLDNKNIIESKICTKCNSDKIYSYRAEKGLIGINLGIIALR